MNFNKIRFKQPPNDYQIHISTFMPSSFISFTCSECINFDCKINRALAYFNYHGWGSSGIALRPFGRSVPQCSYIIITCSRIELNTTNILIELHSYANVCVYRNWCDTQYRTETHNRTCTCAGYLDGTETSKDIGHVARKEPTRLTWKPKAPLPWEMFNFMFTSSEYAKDFETICRLKMFSITVNLKLNMSHSVQRN